MMTNETTLKRRGLKKRGLKAGMTMMETLGVLLVGALLTVGAVMLIRMAMDSAKLSDAQKSLTALSIQVRGHFSGMRDYTGLSNALAIKAGLAPQKILRGDSLLTPWGGAITLAPAANATFTHSWAGLSDQVCTAMATYQVELWQSISINGTAIDPAAAVADADKTAALNGQTKKIQNILGDAATELPKIKDCDILILDPPRAGCAGAVVDAAKEIAPKHILYISCNPATLARDYAILKEKYVIKTLNAYDMFPETGHVETLLHLVKV
jgi:type II secretory pathway pseudopilin PulG